ncbi:uncharacterized protein LOC143150789 [Ptiloglossa arizonensis]|uniref:uncharacterized protein LOC143150789 n=1 Tax=Ptiloglossa arizonensis TaxID=3350558 RepID=UPI003FA18BF7
MLSKTIYNFLRSTICENKLMFHRLWDVSKFNSRQYNLFVNYSSVERNFNCITIKRFKRKGLERTGNNENKGNLEDIDEYLQTNSSQTIKATIPSLRIDIISKVAFGKSRAKIDQEFYNSNIRINGERCLKKNTVVEVEDEIDLIRGRSPNNNKFLIVDRCIVLSIGTTSDNILVELLRNKNLLIEDYADSWNGVK